MIPSLADIEEARRAAEGISLRTPLVRLDLPESPAEIFLKLETLQPIGSFKIRGAAGAVARVPRDVAARGFWAASAGNMAQGVAWMARRLGVPATIVVPETAPEVKVRAIERLGAKVIRVPRDTWWQVFMDRAWPGMEGTFIHAFDDPAVIAANGAIGLEILEDLPDVEAILVPWGGGGLACGIAAALKGAGSRARVYATEVETAAPLAASLRSGRPEKIPYAPSFVDGIGSAGVFPSMFERARGLVAGSFTASVTEVAGAVRLLAERARVVAEGAGACPVAVARAGRCPARRIACVVSGGNIDAGTLADILAGRI